MDFDRSRLRLRKAAFCFNDVWKYRRIAAVFWRILKDFHFNDILLYCCRQSGTAGSGRYVIAFFGAKSLYPVVKGPWIDIMLKTPLLVRQTAAAALHDQPVLLFGWSSGTTHRMNLHKCSEILASLASLSADIEVKCLHYVSQQLWHLYWGNWIHPNIRRLHRFIMLANECIWRILRWY